MPVTHSPTLPGAARPGTRREKLTLGVRATYTTLVIGPKWLGSLVVQARPDALCRYGRLSAAIPGPDGIAMGLLDFFRRGGATPIQDAGGLADFIDRNAAFLVQK